MDLAWEGAHRVACCSGRRRQQYSQPHFQTKGSSVYLTILEEGGHTNQQDLKRLVFDVSEGRSNLLQFAGKRSRWQRSDQHRKIIRIKDYSLLSREDMDCSLTQWHFSNLAEQIATAMWSLPADVAHPWAIGQLHVAVRAECMRH